MTMDLAKRLFVGIKISKALQHDLESPAEGTRHFFEGNDHNEYLQIINVGQARIIGRYINDGLSVADFGRLGVDVGSMLKLITRGRRIEENDIQIYTSQGGI